MKTTFTDNTMHTLKNERKEMSAYEQAMLDMAQEGIAMKPLQLNEWQMIQDVIILNEFENFWGKIVA